MKSKNRSMQLIIGTLTLIIILTMNFTTNANNYSFEVSVYGKGKQTLIFIPGLTCPGEVWQETVDQFKHNYTCHVISLPGFGYKAPVTHTEYLKSMRDELIAYIKSNKLNQPVLVGHSLGGFISLWIASVEPTLVNKLIVVDALPFFPAIQNPSATVESVKPMAENMRKMMAGATPEQVKQNQQFFLSAMATEKDKLELISKWGIESHQPTVAQAMYEMQTIDLRKEIASVKAKVLVLGAWIAYKDYGITRESTMKNFTDQYQLVKHKDIRLSNTAKHFIMYDDPTWFIAQINEFLTSKV
jgi:N-formylmaleamate deformylase